LENKRAEQILPWDGGVGWEKVAQIMYIHVNKCNKDKIKKI
jgi:hypothetical protein